MRPAKSLVQSLTLRYRDEHDPRMFIGRRVALRWWDEGEERVGVAKVVEWTVCGLRIRHNLPLQAKSIVTVVTPEYSLESRVVWIAYLKDHREAGLLNLNAKTTDLKS